MLTFTVIFMSMVSLGLCFPHPATLTRKGTQMRPTSGCTVVGKEITMKLDELFCPFPSVGPKVSMVTFVA